MRLSVVIVTHNRRDTLLSTLTQLAKNPHLPHSDMEVLVVDNHSTDGTPGAVAMAAPRVAVIRRGRNEGACARNYGIDAARGRYVLVLDDDSYPVGDAVARSMAYLDAHPSSAAVTGRVELADGTAEASALPSVMICCAVCLRRAALGRVGPFPLEFSRQAEEYDLSFRLWHEGYRVDRFEDVIYRHEKTPGGRAAAEIHRLDMRNNLMVLARYVPAPLHGEYRQDWVKRYRLLAAHAGHAAAAELGLRQARGWRLRERLAGRPMLVERALESIFGLRQQARAVAAWARQHHVRRVAIADFSKNLYATWRACRECGLEITSIADESPAFAGERYRSIRIGADTDPRHARAEGVVLSTISPARVEGRMKQLGARFGVPVLRLWEPRYLMANGG